MATTVRRGRGPAASSAVRWATALVPLPLVPVLAAGCAEDSAPARPEPTPATVSSTPDEDAARRQIVAAYDGLMRTTSTVSRTASGSGWQAYRRYVAEPLLSQVLADVRDDMGRGIVDRGYRTWTARVTSLQLDVSPPTADLRACLDFSRFRPVFAATGESAKAPGAPSRVLFLARATRIHGRWYIVENSGDVNRPC